jgi:hypothetical protein
MPTSSRSRGLYHSHVIHLTPEAKGEFLAQLRAAAEQLQHERDEFVINAVDCPGHDGPHKLTLKLAATTPLPTSGFSKDVFIAGAIAIGCILLIAVAFMNPKHKHRDGDGEPTVSSPVSAPADRSHPFIPPGPEKSQPTVPR